MNSIEPRVNEVIQTSLNECKTTTYYSIMVDAILDVFHVEQNTFILSYIHFSEERKIAIFEKSFHALLM